MDTSDIVQIIRDQATANGVDPDLLVKFGQVESGLDPNAGASGSSAKGLFQFTNGTASQYGLTDPNDPAASADAAARLMKDNASKLTAAGLDTSPGALYLAHFAGAGGAGSILKADPTASASDILGEAATKANPFLKGMTAGDLIAWANRKMGAGGATAPVQTASGQPAPQGILNQSVQPGATASASPGILNGPDDQAIQGFQTALANLMAKQAQPMPTPAMAPIQMAVPRGIDRARLLAALSSPIGV